MGRRSSDSTPTRGHDRANRPAPQRPRRARDSAGKEQEANAQTEHNGNGRGRVSCCPCFSRADGFESLSVSDGFSPLKGGADQPPWLSTKSREFIGRLVPCLARFFAAVLFAFAELKSRERERDRASYEGMTYYSDNNKIEKIERFYRDVTRLLPPSCEKDDLHVPAAAAAFKAVLTAAPPTIGSAEIIMLRAGVLPALVNLPLGTGGHRALVLIEEAFGPMIAGRLKKKKSGTFENSNVVSMVTLDIYLTNQNQVIGHLNLPVTETKLTQQ